MRAAAPATSSAENIVPLTKLASIAVGTRHSANGESHPPLTMTTPVIERHLDDGAQS